jgi:hypothetical protein
LIHGYFTMRPLLMILKMGDFSTSSFVVMKNKFGYIINTSDLCYV